MQLHKTDIFFPVFIVFRDIFFLVPFTVLVLSPSGMLLAVFELLLIWCSFPFHIQLSSYGPPLLLYRTFLSLFSIFKHSPFSIYPVHWCLIFLSLLCSSFPLFTIIIPLPDPMILFCPSFPCPSHSFISGLLALMSIAVARSIQDGVFCSQHWKQNECACHASFPPDPVIVLVCVIGVCC